MYASAAGPMHVFRVVEQNKKKSNAVHTPYNDQADHFVQHTRNQSIRNERPNRRIHRNMEDEKKNETKKEKKKKKWVKKHYVRFNFSWIGQQIVHIS